MPLSLREAEGPERAARDAGSSGRLGCVSGPSQSPGIMSGVLQSLRDGWITVTSARAVARDFHFWRENVKPSPFHRRKTQWSLILRALRAAEWRGDGTVGAY